MPRIRFEREKPLELIAQQASKKYKKLKVYQEVNELTWQFKQVPENERGGERLKEFKNRARIADTKLRLREKKIEKVLRTHDKTVANYLEYRAKLMAQPRKISERQTVKYRRMKRGAAGSTRLFAEYMGISTKQHYASKREEEWREAKKQGTSPKFSARRNLDYIRMFADRFMFPTTKKAPAVQKPNAPKWFS